MLDLHTQTLSELLEWRGHFDCGRDILGPEVGNN